MGRRLWCWIATICLLPGIVWAQSGGLRSASLPDRTPANPIPSTIPLRSASLPDRTPTQPIPPPGDDLFRARPRDYAPDFHRRPRHRHGFPIGLGYGYGPYFVGGEEPRDAVPEPRTGYLHLQMQPGDAQVYVDGFYMGSVDDFRRMMPGRSLEAGAHRVEVRAPGYETTAFNVLIPPNETVSYRTDLERAGGSVRAVSVAPGVPKTFYVIPGCYAGDKPPRGRLPRGCDRSRVRVVPPQPVLTVKR
jgi:hypothetical protein